MKHLSNIFDSVEQVKEKWEELIRFSLRFPPKIMWIRSSCSWGLQQDESSTRQIFSIFSNRWRQSGKINFLFIRPTGSHLNSEFSEFLQLRTVIWGYLPVQSFRFSHISVREVEKRYSFFSIYPTEYFFVIQKRDIKSVNFWICRLIYLKATLSANNFSSIDYRQILSFVKLVCIW